MIDRRKFLQTLGLGSLLPFRSTAAAAEPSRIFLDEVPVAGLPYYEFDKAEMLRSLSMEETLLLHREPENKYDDSAIELYTTGGKKLGYVPRLDNPIPARLMDQGINLTAVISNIDPSADPWDQIMIRIYLIAG